MKVMKFGGTSVGSPARMRHVAGLICDGEQNFVVLSAMSGTTNQLLEIADYLLKKNPEGASDTIDKLETLYHAHVDALYNTSHFKQLSLNAIHDIFRLLRSFTSTEFTEREAKIVVAQGEMLSTLMMTHLLLEQGQDVCLLSALEFIKTDSNGEPDMVQISKALKQQLSEHDKKQIYITQGFICRDQEGEISNLQRGGSDYTASIAGAVMGVSEIQIWTDIDGMHNNDPRFVEGTSPVEQLHFEEAAELAYFGAKILHPTCIQCREH